jgi:hypothetical protein
MATSATTCEAVSDFEGAAVACSVTTSSSKSTLKMI